MSIFCFPRKARHQWVIFLLVVCLLGVYLTYRRLRASETPPVARDIPRNGPDIEKLQQQLQERVHNDLKLPKAPGIQEHSGKNLEQQQQQDSVGDAAQAIPPGRVLENDEDYITNDEKLARLKLLLLTLSPSNWKTTLDPDEMILLAKSELMDLGIESKLSCREIDQMKSSMNQKQGFFGKKIIDYVQRDMTSDYVLKSVGRDQQLKIECMKMDYREDRCLLMGNYRLVKELVMLNTLNHPSIIKMEGFCLRGETIDPRVAKKGAIIVTEAGNRIELDLFQLLPWGTKLELGIELLKLLIYLENSPLGSLAFDKLHIQDFVMVNLDIKLVDLDNLQIGEYPCSMTSHCAIPEVPSKEITCENKLCKGRNSVRNLILLHEALLAPLLKYSPEGVGTEVTQFVRSVQELRLTPKEVLTWFEKQLDKAGNIDEMPGPKPLKFKASDINEGRPATPQGISGNRDSQNNLPARNSYLDSPVLGDGNVYVQRSDLGSSYRNTYERHGNANYPGRYDYTCEQSRVSWGCVLTVKSLEEAKTACDKDDMCASFVIFSPNPETDAVMTMVKKNANDGSPDSNYGAVLFKKQRQQPNLQRIDQFANQEIQVQPINQRQPSNQGQLTNQEQPSNQKLSVVSGQTSKPNNSLKVCLVKVENVTKSARVRRENRLLTHLGLKGTTEDEWKTYAEGLSMIRYLGASQLVPDAIRGGRFKFQFDTNAKGLKKGEFLAEHGPKHHHVGYLVAYHLDRILGLFVIPPTVSRKISMSELKGMKGDGFPALKFQNISQDSIVQGVVTVSLPPVMRTEELVIEKRTSLVTSIPMFTRQQKAQLEYVLIWALTKMMQPQHGFMGYKGHLVHFEADLAFGSVQKVLTGYFYNCQFPNTIYKTLACYKCADSRKMTTVCGLGFEVIRHLRNNGYASSDIQIGEFNSDQISEMIDNSAATILQVLEQCMKTFSREDVLY